MVVAACLTALAIGGWYLRRLTRSMAHLTQDAEQAARGFQQQIDGLLAERNQARAIVDALAEGVVALDARDQIVFVNPAVEELFGVQAARAQGRPLLEVLRHHELEEALTAARESRCPAVKEWMLFQPRERALRASAIPCEPSAGSGGPHTVLVIQDLTQTHRYERLRREFVANVSHELKSPLTAIRSLTETLLTGALEDAANRHRFVTLVDEEAARLGRLIDDLLALSQLESQAVPLLRAPVALQPLVQEVLATLQPELAKRRVSVSVTLGEQWAVQADPDRLRQVLVNLLDNAIKYNCEGGSITVTAQPEGGCLRVSVADTGIGIPPEDVPRIFERFYRVDKARSRELGGTGLGLAIVKHIVESHGGAVSVASRPGEGSTFSFTLPLV